MIHPENRIRYINKNTGVFHDSFIEVVIQTHVTMEEKLNDHDTIIYFRDHNVMIQDVYGWTELVSLQRHTSPKPMKFLELCNLIGQGVIVTEDELVPCYYPNLTKDGYHGRVLYGYHLRKAKDLYPGMHLRTTASHDPAHQFKEVYSRPLNHKYGRIYVGYTITTRSGVYAANNIILNGGGHDENVSKLTEYAWN